MIMRQMRAAPAVANRMASIEQIRNTLARDLRHTVELRPPDRNVPLLVDAKGQDGWVLLQSSTSMI